MSEQNGVHSYYPEMDHKKPDCQIDAKYVLGKWRLKTPLTLKGRGVRHVMTLTASDLVPQAQHKVGWHIYEVTQAAYDKLKKEYSLAQEILLD